MFELTERNLPDFRRRFMFYDGLIREVAIKYAPGRAARVTLSVRDGEASDLGGWVNLVLEVADVEEIKHMESKGTCVVISWGVGFGFYNGCIYIDLCPQAEEPVSLEEFRRSNLLIVGKRCYWSVLPYTDPQGPY